MKFNEEKIRKDLAAFSVPDCGPEKMRETVRAAKQAYGENLAAKRLGFPEFIAVQIRFIGRWVWMAQAALLLAFLLLWSRYRTGSGGTQDLFLLFSAVAPMVAFVGFPEILKSCSHNMEEIEACTRFSLRKLMGARMLILGLTDLCSLTVILAVSAADESAIILRMILYLFVPFNVTCCGCLAILRRAPGRYGGYSCAAVCMICVAAFAKLSFVRNCYEAAATWAWAVLFFLSAACIVFEIARAFHGFDSFLQAQKGTLSVPW